MIQIDRVLCSLTAGWNNSWANKSFASGIMNKDEWARMHSKRKLQQEWMRWMQLYRLLTTTTYRNKTLRQHFSLICMTDVTLTAPYNHFNVHWQLHKWDEHIWLVRAKRHPPNRKQLTWTLCQAELMKWKWNGNIRLHISHLPTSSECSPATAYLQPGQWTVL